MDDEVRIALAKAERMLAQYREWLAESQMKLAEANAANTILQLQISGGDTADGGVE